MTVASMRRRGIASIAVLALLVPSASWAAGRVEFSIGDVTATDTAGQGRPLAKGAELIAGDTIFTHSGRAQLRFTDGAVISLQPNSEFRIDEYRFAGKADGSERGLFSLIKGGLRTITGLIGRSNRNNYRVSTAVATIGIRGTEYTMAYAGSLSGTVGEGEIAVCNGAGCLNVTNGESYVVANANVLPAMSDKKTDLSPPQPGDPPGGVFETAKDPTKQSNEPPAGVNSLTCSPPGSTNCVPTALSQVAPLTKEQRATVSPGLTVAAIVPPGTNALPAQDALLLTDGNGQAVAVGNYAIGSAVVKESRGDNTASIWSWGDGFATGPGGSIDISGLARLHFAVGTPTSASELSGLRASNTTLSFTTIDAKTTPTVSAGNATLDLRATTLTINFLTLATQVSLDLAVDGTVTTIGGMQGTINATTARFSAAITATTGPSARAEGLLTGQQPNLRGAYVYSVTNLVPNATIAGAVIVKP